MLALLLISLSTSMFAQSKKEDGKNVGKENKEMKCKENKKCCNLGIKGLSDEQKQKIEKIETANQKELLQLRNQLDEKRSHLKSLESADNADLNAINKTIDEISAINGEIMKSDAAKKQEIRKVLTEEQRLQFDLKDAKKCMKEKQNKKCEKQLPNSNHDGSK